MKSRPHPTVYELLVGADWACAHGDAGGLSDVARQLGTRVPESMRGALTAVREAAVTDGDPFARWASVRSSIVESLRDTSDDEREYATQHC